MSRNRSPVPGQSRGIWLPTTLWSEVDLVLFSDLESKVPYGRMKEFFVSAVTRELERLRSERVINKGSDFASLPTIVGGKTYKGLE